MRRLRCAGPSLRCRRRAVPGLPAARCGCGVPGQDSSAPAALCLAFLRLEATAAVCRAKPRVPPPRRAWPCCGSMRLRCAGPSLECRRRAVPGLPAARGGCGVPGQATSGAAAPCLAFLLLDAAAVCRAKPRVPPPRRAWPSCCSRRLRCAEPSLEWRRRAVPGIPAARGDCGVPGQASSAAAAPLECRRRAVPGLPTARGGCGVPGQASSAAAAPCLAFMRLEATAVCRAKPPVAPPRRAWPSCGSRRRLRCAGPSLECRRRAVPGLPAARCGCGVPGQASSGAAAPCLALMLPDAAAVCRAKPPVPPQCRAWPSCCSRRRLRRRLRCAGPSLQCRRRAVLGLPAARGGCGVPGQASSAAAAPCLAFLLLEATTAVCRAKPRVAPPR
eukprot:scaffold8949_cov48-Phaeocystis_antarctica.AAC.1